MGSLLNFSTVQKPDGTSQEAVHQWRNDIERPSSPGCHNPRPQYVRGSVSNTSIPGIEIVTPVSKYISHFVILLRGSLVLSHFVDSFSKDCYRSYTSYTRKCKINASFTAHHRSTSNHKLEPVFQSTIFYVYVRR
jgi:hypothetical protein